MILSCKTIVLLKKRQNKKQIGVPDQSNW